MRLRIVEKGQEDNIQMSDWKLPKIPPEAGKTIDGYKIYSVSKDKSLETGHWLTQEEMEKKKIDEEDCCRVYIFPVAQHTRILGCPMRTHDRKVAQEETKKLNPMKASKRGHK